MEFSIDRLAQLARLQLSRKKEEQLKHDLERITTYVDQLREIDTESAAELTHAAPEINQLREDASPRAYNEKEVANLRDAFPERAAGYARVPLVITKK